MKKFLLSFMLMAVLFPLTINAQEIIVGEATDAKNLAPFVNSYPHSWCEIVYQSDEIGKACSIGGVAFEYYDGPALATNEIKIYLAETTKTEFADKSQWTAEEDLTLVYSGTDVVLGDDAWETFEFETPFNYSGENNLIIVVSKTANDKELMLRWSCYDAANNVMFTASDTDASFAQYPAGEGLATYGKKPIMKLIENSSEPEDPEEPSVPAAPTNLRALVEQDLPDFPNYKYKVTFLWDAVEGADGYEVYVNTADTSNFLMGTSSGTAYICGANNEATLEFYVVTVIDSLVSAPSEICTVVIEDDAVEELTSSFNIYPNSVGNELFITAELNVEEISVYDVYGRQAMNQQVNESTRQQVINVADLKAGIYFVKIKAEGGEVVKRFIKN